MFLPTSKRICHAARLLSSAVTSRRLSWLAGTLALPALAVWTCAWLAGTLALPALADNFSGSDLVRGATFLQTGAGAPLIRTNFPWTAPANLSHPALVFAFGFATDESFEPGEFFDSASIVVRNADRSFVAPALTADVFGLTAAPANPDGSQFNEHDVEGEQLPFPTLDGVSPYRSQQAFLVLVALPPALAGQSGTLGVSLFDNLDAEGSLVFINHLAVVPGPGTFLTLDSSASVAGPYAPEGGMTVLHARRCVILPKPSAHRFFRLRGDAASELKSITPDGSDLLFRYGGNGGGVPALESSAQVAGPYAQEPGVISDPLAGTLRMPRDGAARFFRVRSEIPLTIRNLRIVNRQMIFSYEEP